MVKGVWKVFKSARAILLVAAVMSVLFLIHFLSFSTVLDKHVEAPLIDILRGQQIVRTNNAKPLETSNLRAEHSSEDGKDSTSSTDHEKPTAHMPSTDNTQDDPLSNSNKDNNNNNAADVALPVTPAIVESNVPYDLPGGAKHPILRLSDADFRNTPVDVQFAWYGEAQGGGSCAGDFGTSLINRWRSVKQTYCAKAHSAATDSANDAPNNRGGGSDKSNKDLGSSIDCYLVHQTRHHGNGDNLCHMRNVAVDLSLFADDSKTRSVIQKYVDTRHAVQPYIKFPKGFIEGDCIPDHGKWQAQNMPGWNADLTTGAFLSTGTSTAAANADSASTVGTADVCHTWVEHPVLLTQRDTFANFFHDSEDFFNVFIALAVLQWKPSEVQMYLTDLYPQGPFWEIWSKVYSQSVDPTRKALTAWDLRLQYADVPKGKKVCFKDLAVGIYGPAAPMTVASWDTPCHSTALVRAYSDYVIRGLQLHTKTHYSRTTPSDTIVVTYMARRPSKEWPERKYCDSANSFFLCELWANFGERQLGRQVRNDAAVVEALKGLEKVHFANAKHVVVQDVDYNILTFEEQIQTDLNTDVMIGPHGAGLMHNIFMRDRATLVELFVDGSSVNRHFHNLAYWFGREYRGVTISNPVKIPEILELVQEIIRQIDTKSF